MEVKHKRSNRGDEDMQLKGEKISLRPLMLTQVEIEYLQDWLEDEENIRYGGFAKTMPQTLEHVSSYLSKLNNNPNVRIFKIVNPLVYIGNIRIDIDWMWRVATVSLLIGKEHWGKGYGTEAIGLITDFAFNDLGMHRCEAGVLEGNFASTRSFIKNGYKSEGVRRDRRFNQGEYTNEIMYGKIKEDE